MNFQDIERSTLRSFGAMSSPLADEERWEGEGGAALPNDEPVARRTTATATAKEVMRRVFVRCRDVLPVAACPARFVGTLMSVVQDAAVHAIEVHGYANNRRLRDRIRDVLEPLTDAEPSVESGENAGTEPSNGAPKVHEGPKRR